MTRFNLAATAAPLSDDTSTLLLNYLSANYDQAITGVSKSLVNFATNFNDLSSSLYLIVVIPLTKTAEDSEVGGHRRHISDFKRLYIVANGLLEKDNHWKLEEHIHDLIDANFEGLLANGIEDMTITDFNPINTQSDANVLAMIGDSSVVKASSARVTMSYDKVY
jgi:hypothetical protein